MIFDYSVQKNYMYSVDVVDPGNMCLRCESDEGYEYYVITKTIYGKISFLEFGPLLADCDSLLDDFLVKYYKADFKEKTIAKEVSGFINDPKKKITSVKEIQPEEALPLIPNIATAWQNV